MSTPVLRVPRLADYVRELELRGPNVDLTVRLALRKPLQRGSSLRNLYLTSSFVRDIGPLGDYHRTITLTHFEWFFGALGGQAHVDTQLTNEAEVAFATIKAKVLELNLELAAGYWHAFQGGQ